MKKFITMLFLGVAATTAIHALSENPATVIIDNEGNISSEANNSVSTNLHDNAKID